MNIIYVSSTCSRGKYAQYVENRGARISQQAQKYNLLLAEGFAANGAKVDVVSTRPINRSVEKRLWVRAERESADGISFQYVPFVNYPGLRYVWLFFGVFFRIFFSGNKRKGSAVVCDALNVSAAAAALAASFLRGFQTVGIVTDVPCHFSSAKVSMNQKINLFLMRRFDSYLLLTRQMSEVVNPKNRPFLVLEGHADQAMEFVENTLAGKGEKQICMYAGSLMKIYGIGALVEGFLAAEIPNAELHIYGSGDYEETLKKLAAQHDCVKYLGVAPNSEIVGAELAATLLVNPRPSNEDYTQYSFPSKNMEYMASGTPVLTTRLPGMPEDHKPYVYFIEQEDANGIRSALEEVLLQSPGQLHRFGLEAKRFVLKEKNNVIQARRVMDFLKQTEEMESGNRD